MRRLLTKKEVEICLDRLEQCYPDAECELKHHNPFELLVSTILSAQCTDVRVNQVTSEIYPRYGTPQDFADMPLEMLEDMIRPCGFYRNKAKNIHAMAKLLVEKYDSKVPREIEELVKLPGVGKKTANVVASNCFGVPAIAVDTHVFRLANRIGLVDETTVEKTEEGLQKKINKNRWSKAHHLLIFHGRRLCTARKPHCEECPLKDLCRYYLRSGKWSL